jgi:hypothetical protein
MCTGWPVGAVELGAVELLEAAGELLELLDPAGVLTTTEFCGWPLVCELVHPLSAKPAAMMIAAVAVMRRPAVLRELPNVMCFAVLKFGAVLRSRTPARGVLTRRSRAKRGSGCLARRVAMGQ